MASFKGTQSQRSNYGNPQLQLYHRLLDILSVGLYIQLIPPPCTLVIRYYDVAYLDFILE